MSHFLFSINRLLKFCILLSAFAASAAFSQGFLEMPDTDEVPEYERESMLLDLDIPSVRDRDPDPEAGPRLNVKEFRLQGLVEFPELGITREQLVKRVENIRFDLMKEGELTDSGYTLDELGEVSDLIADIEKDSGEQHVGPLEVQKLVFLIREQRRRRGVTLGMIETVADTITRFYREKGFVLAKAYIPEQKVRDGVVTLTLLLGELGEVRVENKKRVSEGLVAKAFAKDMNKPVTSWNVEESLYLVNDVPGLSAQGFFSPGAQVGDTQLTVNVLEENWYSGNFRLDNHGSEETSENRAYLDVYLHDLMGIGDELHLAVLNSYNPDNSTYGSARFKTMMGHPRWRFETGFSTNDFVSRKLGGSVLTFTGESEVFDTSVTYVFSRSRVKNYSMDVQYMDVATVLESAGTTNQDTQKVSLGFNFDVLNEKKRHLYLGRLALSSAESASSGAFGGEGSHYIFSYDFSMLQFVKFPFTDYETRVVYKTKGQFAGEGVSNLNQLSLTGPETTRAFVVNGFQADDAVYAGVDWVLGLPKFGGATFFGEPINKVFQPYLFLDAAYGVQQPFEGQTNNFGNSKVSGKLADIGFGINLNYDAFSASLLAAAVLMDEVDDLTDETPTTSAYVQLQYSF